MRVKKKGIAAKATSSILIINLNLETRVSETGEKCPYSMVLTTKHK